jgi:hypothetical protein
MSHPVNRLMASLRGIQGPRVIPRVTASLEEPPAGSYEPIRPPEWWKREQRVAELNKDHPRPSKLKQWWNWYGGVVLGTLAALIVITILSVAAMFVEAKWLK